MYIIQLFSFFIAILGIAILGIILQFMGIFDQKVIISKKSEINFGLFFVCKNKTCIGYNGLFSSYKMG
jgi:hypothetical protein